MSKVSSSFGYCQVCNQEKGLTKHHIVSAPIRKKYNYSESVNLKIHVCRDCHDDLHNALLLHLAMSMKYGVFKPIASIYYVLLKNWLEVKHHDIFKQWNEFKQYAVQQMIEETKAECENEDVVGVRKT